MEFVKKQGKLKIGSENNRQSVNVVPTTVEESTYFTSLLIKEMRLRGRNTLQKYVAQLQDELCDCLTAEDNMEKLIGQICEGKTREEAMERIMMFALCIIHCETRVGIKSNYVIHRKII